MQQRVGIARAFSIEPDVLLMDEPFSHLDAITSRTLRRELHELWDATGKTVAVRHPRRERGGRALDPRSCCSPRAGTLQDDIAVDLPFPRDSASDEVALAKAELLRKFESLDLVAT